MSQDARFSVVNKNFGTTYNAETADNVFMAGINFSIVGTEAGGHGGIGFGNVASGRIEDCEGVTTGTLAAGAVWDIYACVKNFVALRIKGKNLTEGAHGPGMNIHNQTATATAGESSNATENIRIYDSYFSTGTEDEALGSLAA